MLLAFVLPSIGMLKGFFDVFCGGYTWGNSFGCRRCKSIEITTLCFLATRIISFICIDSPMVRINRFQRLGPGSIPGQCIL